MDKVLSFVHNILILMAFLGTCAFVWTGLALCECKSKKRRANKPDSAKR